MISKNRGKRIGKSKNVLISLSPGSASTEYNYLIEPR
jgi:hypothetical protein